MSGILMKQVCKPFSPYEKVEITVEVLDKICNLSVHKELARELREKTRIRKFISFASISVNSRAKLLRMPLKNLPHPPRRPDTPRRGVRRNWRVPARPVDP